MHHDHPVMGTPLRVWVTQRRSALLRTLHPHRKTPLNPRVWIWDTGETLKRLMTTGVKHRQPLLHRVSKQNTDPCLILGKTRVSKMAIPVSQNGTLTL